MGGVHDLRLKPQGIRLQAESLRVSATSDFFEVLQQGFVLASLSERAVQIAEVVVGVLDTEDDLRPRGGIQLVVDFGRLGCKLALGGALAQAGNALGD